MELPFKAIACIGLLGLGLPGRGAAAPDARGSLPPAPPLRLQTPRQIMVTIPAGTPVAIALAEAAASEKGTITGADVAGTVASDVVVAGQVVIPLGSPVLLRVAIARPATLGGRPGLLELESLQTTAVDGGNVVLEGRHRVTGSRRSRGMRALVFLRGNAAALEAGTLLEGRVRYGATVSVGGRSRTTPRTQTPAGNLRIEAVRPEGVDRIPIRWLSVKLSTCEGPSPNPAVVRVDGEPIAAVPIAMSSVWEELGCTAGRGQIDLRRLGTHLHRGLNRCEITAGAVSGELLLDLTD